MNLKSAKYITTIGLAFTVTILLYPAYFDAPHIKKSDNFALSPENPRIVSLGKEVYAQNCASCHGADLEGEVEDWRSPKQDGKLPAPPHDETGHTWHHTDQVLFKITKFGIAKAANLKDYESAMPAYESILSDDEIIAVLSFIKSSWPKQLRHQHDQLNEAATRRQKQE